MKAVQFTRYGSSDVLHMAELPIPKPGPHEVLIKVHAVGMNPLDWKVRSGSLKYVYPVKMPYVPGYDIAGTVEDTGYKVTRFKPGDEVFAMLSMRGGGYAEYTVADETFTFKKPRCFTLEDAAAIPGSGLTAYQGLVHIGNIRPTQNVLIYGASGGVGSYAIQFAKAYHTLVTAVCSSENAAFVTQLGADFTIDYTKESVYDQKKQYDIIFDTVAVMNFWKALPILKKGGRLVSTIPNPSYMYQSWITSLFLGKKYTPVVSYPDQKDMYAIIKLIEENKITSPVTTVLAFEDFCKANHMLEGNHVKGKIVLKLR
ncbi:MAG: NAD(P)-dependent alcohol dehydrogenase [Patescibacteria group bacterium]|nr:NAD(P)-dependent alcohol dehydrogenase [Patescibacteria group bacterium]